MLTSHEHETVTPTDKRQEDVMDRASEATAGLGRLSDEPCHMIRSELNQGRTALGALYPEAAKDIAARAEAEAASKRADDDLDRVNALCVAYGAVVHDDVLKLVNLDSEADVTAEDILIPKLETMNRPASKAIADLTLDVLKEKRHADKLRAKATEKAAHSSARWSDQYNTVSRLIRQARALQVAEGLDVPLLKPRKPASAKTKDGGADPIEGGEGPPVVKPVEAANPLPNAPQPASIPTSSTRAFFIRLPASLR